jgi:RNA polymerase subunit RPABC4/transcription elongation factor Spt4
MPVFEIYCNRCHEYSETIGEHHKLKCPLCKSEDVKRRWNGSPVIIMKGEVNGSSKGVREEARRIMKLETEKINKGAYG